MLNILKLSSTLLFLNLSYYIHCFNISSSNNVVAYWGQNSYGNAPEAHQASMERPISDYCKDDTYDMLVMSFLIKFNAEVKNGHPILNLGKHCSRKFPNSQHPYCPEVAAGIKFCQSKGKKILLSMGGYAGDYTLANDDSANTFAQRIWDLYLGGKAEHRPFGEVVLDGIDLDIEKGPPESYAVFSNKLKEIIDKQDQDNKREYFITAAPQCPFPDQYLKNVLEHGWLDLVFVQFYNNECAIGKEGFNFATWDGWARFASKNKQAKVFLGAPGGPSAAGSGYLNYQELEPIIDEVKAKYPAFGGVMLWDVSQADQNVCPDVKKIYSVAISHQLKGEYEVKQPGNNKIKGDNNESKGNNNESKENKESKDKNNENKETTSDKLPKKDRSSISEKAKNRMPDSSLMDFAELPSTVEGDIIEDKSSKHENNEAKDSNKLKPEKIEDNPKNSINIEEKDTDIIEDNTEKNMIAGDSNKSANITEHLPRYDNTRSLIPIESKEDKTKPESITESNIGDEIRKLKDAAISTLNSHLNPKKKNSTESSNNNITTDKEAQNVELNNHSENKGKDSIEHDKNNSTLNSDQQNNNNIESKDGGKVDLNNDQTSNESNNPNKDIILVSSIKPKEDDKNPSADKSKDNNAKEQDKPKDNDAQSKPNENNISPSDKPKENSVPLTDQPKEINNNNAPADKPKESNVNSEDKNKVDGNQPQDNPKEMSIPPANEPKENNTTSEEQSKKDNNQSQDKPKENNNLPTEQHKEGSNPSPDQPKEMNNNNAPADKPKDNNSAPNDNPKEISNPPTNKPKNNDAQPVEQPKGVSNSPKDQSKEKNNDMSKDEVKETSATVPRENDNSPIDKPIENNKQPSEEHVKEMNNNMHPKEDSAATPIEKPKQENQSTDKPKEASLDSNGDKAKVDNKPSDGNAAKESKP